LAAALAFFAVLSIPPLLVLIIMIVGQFASGEAAQQAIVQQVEQVVGSQGANAIEMILDAASRPEGLSLAALTSGVVLLFGASGVFVQLQDALNTVWSVRPDPEKGIMNMIQKRVVSFVMILAVGALFLILLLLSSIVAFLGTQINEALPGSLPVFQVLNVVMGFLLLTGVFALLFRTVPDVTIAWRDVWLGAAVTAVLFVLGVFGMGLYLGFSNPASNYGGAAGSLIVLMIWIYYSTQIFFLGAEFTQVYANLYGSQIVPEEGAVRIRRVTGPAPSQPGPTPAEPQGEAS
jgi:membrane protein